MSETKLECAAHRCLFACNILISPAPEVMLEPRGLAWELWEVETQVSEEAPPSDCWHYLKSPEEAPLLLRPALRGGGLSRVGWCLWGCEEGGYGNVTSSWELEPTAPDRMRGHCRGDTGKQRGSHACCRCSISYPHWQNPTVRSWQSRGAPRRALASNTECT